MIARISEKYGPFLIGLAALCVSYHYQAQFFIMSSASEWHVDALYGSVFNIAAAASAFLFAFYTYVRTAEGNILREIRAAAVFRRAARYIIRAIVSTAILSVATVPFMVVVPEPQTASESWYWAVCLWTALSFYVLAAIIRSAYHFIAIMEAAYGSRLGG